MIVFTVGDIASFVIGLILLSILGILALVGRIKKSKCSHPEYIETMGCDAECASCGKNLGFIGDYRKK